jgi:hypothetical protein
MRRFPHETLKSGILTFVLQAEVETGRRVCRRDLGPMAEVAEATLARLARPAASPRWLAALLCELA